MSRRIARQKALQILFGIEVGDSDKELMFKEILEETGTSNYFKNYTKELVNGVLFHINDLDKLIAANTESWEINRIGKVELSAMRLAVYEMLYIEDIPPLVSIDEALELVRYFSFDDSVKFVNGILDSIYNKIIQRKK